MDFMGGQGLSELSNLLKESEQAKERNLSGQMAPGAESTTIVKTGSAASVKAKSNTETEEEKRRKENEIWKEEEVPHEEAIIDENDDRPTPRYEFSFKQSIGASDTFLGMNDITPASFDCTHLVVKVHFPGSNMKEISLDVTKNRIKATSKTHKLFTYLPQAVKKDEGKAEWDPKKSVLSVTLPIIHELGGF